MDTIRDPKKNRGLSANTGLEGYLPTNPLTIQQQGEIIVRNLRKLKDQPLMQYASLMRIEAINTTLFYYVIQQNLRELLPIIYTPTVGEACQNFSSVYDWPRACYLNYEQHKGKLNSVLANWAEKRVSAICVTDGERILGLGDLGVYGLGIPIGKLGIYTAVGGVLPELCLPICLDVGTNTKSLIDDPYYYGLKKSRVEGEEYFKFLDEFMTAAVANFGENTLIQFEDFANHKAFSLLDRYKDKYCCFNDDIQGTASVTLAAVIAASLRVGKKLHENTFLFVGAGEAALGIATLLVSYMTTEEKVTEKDALSTISLVDSRGLVTVGREGVTAHKARFARDCAPIALLLDVVTTLKPNCIVGASAQGGAFTKQILTSMGEAHASPIILSLSNPTSKSECTAEEAYTATGGRCLFASGSPFPNVKYDGKEFEPTQCNNAYIFPGMGMGIVEAGARRVPEKMFLAAAECLATLTTAEERARGQLFPSQDKLIEVSAKVAAVTMEVADKLGLAANETPKDKLAFITARQYKAKYE